MKKIIISCIIILLSQPSLAILQEKEVVKLIKDTQRFRLAQQYETAGRFAEALQLYQRLWSANIQNLNYYQGVKNCLLNLKRFPEALQATETMLKIKTNFYIETDLSEIYYQMGDSEKAFLLWNNIIERNKTQPIVYQAVAKSMLSAGLIDKAIEVYKIGKKNNSDKALFLMELANLYSSRLDYQNATLMYLEYLRYMPNQFSYIESQLLRLAKNIEETEPIIEVITAEIKNHKDSLLLRKLLAELYIQSSNYKQALEAYKYIDDKRIYDVSNGKEEFSNELFDFAQNALNDGAYEYSRQAFMMFIARYPDSPLLPRAHLGLAEAAYRQRDYTKALELYEQIIANYPRLAEAKLSYLKIGEIRLNLLNDPNAAKEAFIEILNKFPYGNDYFEAMFKIGECEIHLGNLDEAKKWYQKIIRSAKAANKIIERTQYQLAQLDFWQGNFDMALQELQPLTEIQYTIRSNEEGFYVNDALNLSIFIEENKKEPEMLKMYAECLLLNERHLYIEALTKLKMLVEKNTKSILADDIWVLIGDLENNLQHFQEAIQAYRILIDYYPKSIYCDLAQKRIGEIYETKLENIGLAIKEYELVLSNYPASILLEEVRNKIRDLEKPH